MAALGTIGQDGTLTDAQRLSRVRSAVLLITLSPEYLIQR